MKPTFTHLRPHFKARSYELTVQETFFFSFPLPVFTFHKREAKFPEQANTGCLLVFRLKLRRSGAVRTGQKTHTLTDHVIGHVDLDLSFCLKGHLTFDALVGFLLQDQRQRPTALMSGSASFQAPPPPAHLTLGAGTASDFFPAAALSALTSGWSVWTWLSRSSWLSNFTLHSGHLSAPAPLSACASPAPPPWVGLWLFVPLTGWRRLV